MFPVGHPELSAAAADEAIGCCRYFMTDASVVEMTSQDIGWLDNIA
jgi:hypothetical protein